MKMQISKRLTKIASYVTPYQHLIDVGTDHCLVPIYLVLNNLIDSAIASDINEGPVNEAKKNVVNNQLQSIIDIRIGNGLETITLNDRADVIIIAGMGGKLITDILETGNKIMHLNKRLILQPNVNEDAVRRYLSNNHYEIVFEEIIKEDDIFYEIIVSDHVSHNVNYSEDEILFGPKLLIEKSDLFYEKWKYVLQYKKETLLKIPDNHENKKRFLDEIKQIEKVLNI